MSDIHAHCSHCLNNSTHRLTEQNYLRRNLYRCQTCGETTVQCRVCKDMAVHKEGYSSELCAQHDGSILSFEGLEIRLHSLDEYEKLLSLRRTNLPARTMDANFLNIRSVSTAITAMRSIAQQTALLGSLRLTLAASAATTSALFSALGSKDHFHVQRLRTGQQHALVVVDGFLSQKGDGVPDWTQHQDRILSDCTWFHVGWAASTRLQLLPAAKDLDIFVFNKTAARAQEAGRILAQLIEQTDGWTYTLAGHSLGGAVVAHTLLNLPSRCKGKVQDAYLLGAALELTPGEWVKAAEMTDGRLVNAWSRRDNVLKLLYTASTLGKVAAGRRPIAGDTPKIKNVDMTDKVDEHTNWKNHFPEVVVRAGRA